MLLTVYGTEWPISLLENLTMDLPFVFSLVSSYVCTDLDSGILNTDTVFLNCYRGSIPHGTEEQTDGQTRRLLRPMGRQPHYSGSIDNGRVHIRSIRSNKPLEAVSRLTMAESNDTRLKSRVCSRKIILHSIRFL